MKIKFLLVSTLVLIAVGLSGCFFQKEEPAQEPQEANADAILDNRIFLEATAALNAKRCDEIKISVKKDECKTTVESLMLMNEAAQQRDKNACKKIKLQRYAESCESSVEQAVAEDKKQETALKEAENQEKLAEEIFKSKDIEKCYQLQDSYKIACKENILNALAVENLDKTVCEKHDEKEKVEQCKQLVENNQ